MNRFHREESNFLCKIDRCDREFGTCRSFVVHVYRTHKEVIEKSTKTTDIRLEVPIAENADSDDGQLMIESQSGTGTSLQEIAKRNKNFEDSFLFTLRCREEFTLPKSTFRDIMPKKWPGSEYEMRLSQYLHNQLEKMQNLQSKSGMVRTFRSAIVDHLFKDIMENYRCVYWVF